MALRQGEVGIRISAKDDASRTINKVAGEVHGLGKASHAAVAGVQRLGGGLVALGSAYLTLSTAQAAMDKFAQQEQAVASLNAALESMNRITPNLSQNLQQLAGQIQSKGIIGDEAIIKGQAFLATYSDIADNMLPRATRLMTDLAAKMGGDVVSAANMVGKASMGMVGELSKVGITFSEEAKRTKDFKLIMKEMEQQVGGTNAALAKTNSGAMLQFKNLVGDLQEKLGGMLTIGLMPVVQEFSAMAVQMNDAADAADTVKTKGQEVALVVAQLADGARNAAVGIALPFKLGADQVTAFAAVSSMVLQGDFAGAVRVGKVAAEDMKKALMEATDPKLSKRFENRAMEMIKASQDLKDGLDKTAAAAINAGKDLQQVGVDAINGIEPANKAMAQLQSQLQAMLKKNADANAALFEQTGKGASRFIADQRRAIDAEVQSILQAGASAAEAKAFMDSKLAELRQKVHAAGTADAARAGGKIAYVDTAAEVARIREGIQSAADQATAFSVKLGQSKDQLAKMAENFAKVLPKNEAVLIKSRIAEIVGEVDKLQQGSQISASFDAVAALASINKVMQEIAAIPREVVTYHRIVSMGQAGGSDTAAAAAQQVGSRATGGAIPVDGLYQLHAGERVINNNSSHNYSIYLGGERDRAWVRGVLIPELEAAGR